MTYIVEAIIPSINISTHTLTWSVTISSGFQSFLYHFNSHAHVERDSFVQCLLLFLQISTHTLTWSVTSIKGAYAHVPSISTHTLTWSVTTVLIFGFVDLTISTHTLTWSVTILVVRCFDLNPHFNSHAHVERDQDAVLV